MTDRVYFEIQRWQQNQRPRKITDRGYFEIQRRRRKNQRPRKITDWGYFEIQRRRRQNQRPRKITAAKTTASEDNGSGTNFQALEFVISYAEHPIHAENLLPNSKYDAPLFDGLEAQRTASNTIPPQCQNKMS